MQSPPRRCLHCWDICFNRDRTTRQQKTCPALLRGLCLTREKAVCTAEITGEVSGIHQARKASQRGRQRPSQSKDSPALSSLVVSGMPRASLTTVSLSWPPRQRCPPTPRRLVLRLVWTSQQTHKTWLKVSNLCSPAPGTKAWLPLLKPQFLHLEKGNDSPSLKSMRLG